MTHQKRPDSWAPKTSRRPVWNSYHGTRVRDDYRWLEDGDSQEVHRWSTTQNRRARSYLGAIPARRAVGRRIAHFLRSGYVLYGKPRVAKNRMFIMRWDTREPRPVLLVYDSLEDLHHPRVLIDPARWSRKGAPASVNHFAPSWDGKWLAVCISRGGTEESDLQILDADTGRPTEERVRRASRVGGRDAAWFSDNSGFLYIRYPREGERPAKDLEFYQQVFFHRLGTSDDEDEYVLGKEFPRIGEPRFESYPDRNTLVVSVEHGDGGQFEHWVGGGKDPWTRIANPQDEVTAVHSAPDRSIYLLSRKGAPRGQILRIPPDGKNVSQAELVVEEGDWVIDSFEASRDHLVLIEQLGGAGRLRALELHTRRFISPKLPSVCAMPWAVSLPDESVIFRLSTLLAPPAVVHWDPRGSSIRSTPLTLSSPANLSRWKVIRESAISRDGTHVPMTIIAPKGLRKDGSRPLLLNGYGGYGFSILPEYRPWILPWLEAGGLFAVAHTRGGGEFGEEWHRDGMLTKKQNVFDDFIATAEHLIRRGYTNSRRLAIIGGSNGGLLMGAAFTQRPELFRAVVAQVGVFDSLRSELEPNGAYNVTEFGTVKDPAEFRALYSYSPYHRVVDGTHYPAVLFQVGENDRRVAPYHSRKMVARMQAANASGEPLLLRVEGGSGHGVSQTQELEDLHTDTIVFLMDRVGLISKSSAFGGFGR